MILTPLSLILLLLPALLVVAGGWFADVDLYAWPLLALGALLVVVDNLLSRRLARLTLEREVDDKLSLGAANRVCVRLRSHTGRRQSLILKDDPPTEFVTDRRVQRVRLDPYEQAAVSYHTRPRNRGRYSFGDLHLRGLSVLGLSYWQRTVPAAQEIAVYPNLLEVRRYQLLARTDRLQQAGFRVLQRPGQGMEFESLREYSPDDEFRSIDWKASARRNKPISRQYDVERSQTMIIMIDAGRMMTANIGEMSRLDYAINAALMLAYVATEKDDAVGLITFGAEVHDYVPPRKGRHQVGRITEALYDLQPALVEPNYAEAFGLLHGRARKRALVVCFTDLVDMDASRRLLSYLAALAPHHLPFLITLRDSSVEASARQMPEDSFGVYQRTMAGQVLADREAALAVLRQRGVLVLDAPPEKLTVASVNEYLGLKARGRL